jgi:hypothetical protein
MLHFQGICLDDNVTTFDLPHELENWFKSTRYPRLERCASALLNCVSSGRYLERMPRDTLTREQIVQAAIELLDTRVWKV